eukprot:CAMPEP_0113463724 /NCGR_PEP_ID=MMETSP0014_2-20120614/12812_1 /TAXON_ID=2857 /ORGANISM="Nitzschia sp." /LENGTH=535 /DNA_ID=CAMNT_0000355741 /DNA_START=386 /DNA_END=1989 /DNA_ORIENTATION=- /assembly_acc=CAM_ASM_000159
MKKAPPTTPGRKAPPLAASTPNKAPPSTPTASADELAHNLEGLNLEALYEERNKIKDTKGSTHPDYIAINNKIVRLKTPKKKKKVQNARDYQNKKAVTTQATLAIAEMHASSIPPTTLTTIDGTRWGQNKHKYKDLDTTPKPSNVIRKSVFGGRQVQTLKLPTEEDVKASDPNFKPLPKVVEGGWLDFEYHFADDLNFSDIRKNRIVSIIGKGFASPHNIEGDQEFSFGDAEVAHHLLFAKSKQAKTLVVEIFYSYEDETRREMRGIAGAMIFSRDFSVTKPDGSGMYKQKLCAFNLVQFTIIKDYSSRHLGMIAIHTIPELMCQKGIDGDFVFWAGCSCRFYNRCGIQADMRAFDCPFNIDVDEEGNRKMFFYMDTKSDDPSNSKFQKNVLSQYSPGQNRFKISYNDEWLNGYYGLLDKDGRLVKVIKKSKVIKEQPRVDYKNLAEETSQLSIAIENYPPQSWKLQVIGEYLFIFSTRKEGDTDYEFEVSFKFAKEVTAESIITHQFLASHSELVVSLKCKMELANSILHLRET